MVAKLESHILIFNVIVIEIKVMMILLNLFLILSIETQNFIIMQLNSHNDNNCYVSVFSYAEHFIAYVFISKCKGKHLFPIQLQAVLNVNISISPALQVHKQQHFSKHQHSYVYSSRECSFTLVILPIFSGLNVCFSHIGVKRGMFIYH